MLNIKMEKNPNGRAEFWAPTKLPSRARPSSQTRAQMNLPVRVDDDKAHETEGTKKTQLRLSTLETSTPRVLSPVSAPPLPHPTQLPSYAGGRQPSGAERLRGWWWQWRWLLPRGGPAEPRRARRRRGAPAAPPPSPSTRRPRPGLVRAFWILCVSIRPFDL